MNTAAPGAVLPIISTCVESTPQWEEVSRKMGGFLPKGSGLEKLPRKTDHGGLTPVLWRALHRRATAQPRAAQIPDHLPPGPGGEHGILPPKAKGDLC